MNKRIRVIFVLTLSIFGLAISASAQRDLTAADVRNPIDSRSQASRVPTLGCCRCLEGSNTLDLSTISGSGWTVNNVPVTILTTPSPAWTIPTGSAKWVSFDATGRGPIGTTDYKLKFAVPNCSIEQEISLTGTIGADNNVQVLLNGTNILSCSGSYCFRAGSTAPGPLNRTIGPGNHELIVRVQNEGGPTGMFVNAKLASKCSTKLIKDDRGPR